MQNFSNALISLIHTYNNSVSSFSDIEKLHCLINDKFIKDNVISYFSWFKQNLYQLEYFYNLLELIKERHLFLNMVATKLGCLNITNEQQAQYLQSRNQFDNLLIDDSIKQLKSATRKLKFYNLSKLGYKLKLYGSRALLDKLIIHNQYCHNNCKIEKDDYVIDAGGCWGDTSLIFSSKVGENGKVFCFEFLKDNIDILKENFLNNLELSKNISLIQMPIYDKSNQTLYTQKECADITALTNKKIANSKKYKTISIDDFIRENKIIKLNFIKMDIEGCELQALHGAINTLKKYKPKLAIAAYHKYDDYYEIAKFLKKLNLGYKFYFSNYTLNFSDTIIYAS